MSADIFLSMPASQAREYHLRAAAGDEEAAAFFRDLFPPGAACWLCDGPTDPAERLVSILPDVRNPAALLLAPQCSACAARPDRRQREMALLRALWPGKRWRPNKGGDPLYLPIGTNSPLNTVP